MLLVNISCAAAHSRQYEVGTVYEYDYETSVLLNEPQPNPVSTAKDVGFRIRVKAEITPVWQHSTNDNEQLIQITVSNLHLFAFKCISNYTLRIASLY